MIDVSEIKMLKDNGYYRFADVVRCGGSTWERCHRMIRFDDKYAGTLLRDYLEQKTQLSYDFETLTRLAWEHIERRDLKLADDKELVVYMRTGDLLVKPKSNKRRRRILNNYRVHFPRKLDEIKKLDFNKVTIVTAMHFGSHPDFEKDRVNGWVGGEEQDHVYVEGHEQATYEAVRLVESYFPEYPVTLQSNPDSDVDFLYLVSSKLLIAGSSEYAEIASNCRRVKGSTAWGHKHSGRNQEINSDCVMIYL